MKVKATMTVVLNYEIDSLHYAHCGKDIILAIEKDFFELNPVFLVNLSNVEITAKVEEVK